MHVYHRHSLNKRACRCSPRRKKEKKSLFACVVCFVMYALRQCQLSCSTTLQACCAVMTARGNEVPHKGNESGSMLSVSVARHKQAPAVLRLSHSWCIQLVRIFLGQVTKASSAAGQAQHILWEHWSSLGLQLRSYATVPLVATAPFDPPGGNGGHPLPASSAS
jgi:hypothetical protein